MPPPEPRSRTVSPSCSVGDRGRVAAAEAGQLGGLGQGVAVVGVVEAGAEELALLVGDHGRVAAAATPTPCWPRRRPAA